MRLSFSGSVVVGALLAGSSITASPVLATRATAPLPFNAAQPGPTPRYVAPAPPILLTLVDTLGLVGATIGIQVNGLLGQALASQVAAAGQAAQKNQLNAVQGLLNGVGGLLGGLFPKPASPATPSSSVTSSFVASSSVASTSVASSSFAASSASSSSSEIPSSVESSSLVSSSTSSTPTATITSTGGAVSATPTCLGAGTTEKQINSLFSYGGIGITVYLCPGTLVNTAAEIQFSAANQTLTTMGMPLATIRVTGALQTTAISGFTNYITLSNVIVDGNRPGLGYYSPAIGGNALIEMGGNSVGQRVEGITAYEPRSWSTLHGIEGTANACSGMTIVNNNIGPSGSSSNGQYADGISIACKNSLVSGNTIIDATDGHIVVFGCPGCTITGNFITANTRIALGGINMVDYSPFSGSYAGCVVSGNTLNANTAMIHSGISVGSLVWGSQNNSATFTSGGTISGNIFMSGTASGYFGYGLSIAGNKGASVPKNYFNNANFGGVNGTSCVLNALPPAPYALYFDPYTTGKKAADLQADFKAARLSFMICTNPQSPPTTIGYSD